MIMDQDKNRAFDIIVKKNVDLPLFKRCGNVVSYNSQVFASQTLTLDEFDFLKGVLAKC